LFCGHRRVGFQNEGKPILSSSECIEEMQNAYKILFGNMKGRYHMRDLDVQRREYGLDAAGLGCVPLASSSDYYRESSGSIK
jgi:hypothetical protein